MEDIKLITNENRPYLNRDFLKQRGFVLLEVLFAIFILGIALFSIALVFSKGSVMISNVRQLAIATQAAKEEMELIRTMAFDDILALGPTFTAAGFSNLSNPLGTLTVDNPGSTDDMRRVSVTVTWSSTDGRTLSKQLITQITRGGINGQ